MKCQKCDHENKEGRKFCSKCGSELENVCPKCGYKNDPEDDFCGECGGKLVSATPVVAQEIPRLEDMKDKLYVPEPLRKRMDTAKQELQGENRLVTALFADISGFSRLSNQHSSEKVVGIVNDCFKVIIDVTFEYEGDPNRFIGDNVLAFFGAPIAHENDPERAIMAGLEIREKVRELSLEVSIGINTGMMYFGHIGTREHHEISAYGPDINLAKRLQEYAEPGQILVGNGTYRFTRRAFDFDVLKSLNLKGFDQPITAYSVQQRKLHPEKIRGIEGLRARMIGREHEFSEAKEAVDQWLSCHGQMVSIIGEAGIGKSRLVSELKDYIDYGVRKLRLRTAEAALQHSKNTPLHPSQEGSLRDSPLTKETSLDSPLKKGDKESCLYNTPYLEGRCVSIGQPISYWPFLDILRTYFQLSEGDDPTTIANKVIEGIKNIFPASAEEILPFLGHLLSIKFGNELDDRLKFATPEQIRHQTLMQLRDLFRTLAERQPLLLILEDLHWADDLSLDLISLLMDELAHTPLMLLCVYRPEKEHRVRQLSDQANRKCLDRYTEIVLKPLTSFESRQLVEELLAIENLPENIRDMILQKSEGNPFFIEEVIRSLMEQDAIYREEDHWKARSEITNINVPDTIQSVVLSRVDRLQAEAKYVLQCASVIGRLFRYRLLEHLNQQERNLYGHLGDLEGRDLIHEERTVPELEYAFKHAFTQEATYQGILEQKRKEFHLQVAQGIERLYQERLEEYYEELAEHYSKSDDIEKAIEYLLKAGEKAQSIFSNEYAIHCFNQAISLIEKMPDTKEHKEQKLDALMKLAKVYFTIGQNEKAIEVAEDAIKIAEEISTLRVVAKICYQIADALLVLDKFDEALTWSEKGLMALGDDKICPESALLNFCAWQSWRFLGNELKSKEYQAKNLGMIREIGYFDDIYKIYVGIRWSSGKAEDANAWDRELIEVCTQHNNQLGLAEGYITLGYRLYCHAIGTLFEPIEYLKKGLAIAKRIGYMLFVLVGSSWLGEMLIEAEDKIEAEKQLRKAIDIMESWGKQFEGGQTVYAYMCLAEILVERGELEQAHYYLVKGLRYSLSEEEIQDFLTSLKDCCQKMGKPEEFMAICNAELERRDRDEEKQIIKDTLADFQKQ